MGDDMEAEAKEHIMALEEELLNAELDIPIYFAEETEELLELYTTLTSEGEGSEAATSAMAALLQSVSNSGYQLVVTAPTPQPLLWLTMMLVEPHQVLPLVQIATVLVCPCFL